MKKIITVALVLCMALTIFAACAPAPSEQISGGYTADRALTAEDKAIFDEVMKDIMGVGYTPTLVATQVVSGINYRFTCDAEVIVPDGEKYTAYVVIYAPLEGKPELTSIEKK